jgi:hypothetical protein
MSDKREGTAGERLAALAGRSARIVFRAELRRRFVSFSAAAFFCAGAAAVTLKTLGFGGAPLMWGCVLSALLFSVLAAWLSARGRAPSASNAAVWLGSRSGGGGLLLASAELPLGEWEREIVFPKPPVCVSKPSERGKNLWFLLSLLFMAACFLAPVKKLSVIAYHSMDLSAETRKMEEDLKTLEDAAVLTPEERGELAEELSKIAARADGSDPAKTWEALDHAERKISDSAEAAAERARKNLELMSMLEDCANGMSGAAGNCPEGLFDDAGKELAELLQKLAAENKELAEALKNAGLSAKKLSPEELKKLASACKLSKERAKELIEKLKKCGACKKCSGGSCDSVALISLDEFLKSNCSGGDKRALAALLRGKPGDGGVSRGRGDAPITYQERGLKHDGGWNDSALPSGAVSQADGVVTAVSYTAPDTAPESPSWPGALVAAKSGHADTQRRVIHPGHRAAVQRYFSGKSENSAEHP